MISVRGIYDGQNIMPLEKIYVKPNVKVIITFLEEDTETIKREKDKPERKSGTLRRYYLLCFFWHGKKDFHLLKSYRNQQTKYLLYLLKL
ncbi:MAG: hypothetical protein HQK76_04345 [Desulfobacterales bacterium]|nr:hypothetical protein [Desulfobacterales bacterium]